MPSQRSRRASHRPTFARHRGLRRRRRSATAPACSCRRHRGCSHPAPQCIGAAAAAFVRNCAVARSRVFACTVNQSLRAGKHDLRAVFGGALEQLVGSHAGCANRTAGPPTNVQRPHGHSAPGTGGCTPDTRIHLRHRRLVWFGRDALAVPDVLRQRREEDRFTVGGERVERRSLEEFAAAQDSAAPAQQFRAAPSAVDIDSVGTWLSTPEYSYSDGLCPTVVSNGHRMRGRHRRVRSWASRKRRASSPPSRLWRR